MRAKLGATTRRAYIYMLLAFLTLPAGWTALPPAMASEGRAETHHHVLIGPAPLHFVVHLGRTDAPVILLESGADLDATQWNAVIAALRGKTQATIVAYDRAGMGESKPLLTPYDVHEEMSRLHRGLYGLGLHQRLLLVGHSYGGMLIQLYANLYPASVVGLVYVDPATVQGMGGPVGARSLIEPILLGARPFGDMRLAAAYVATVETLERYPPPCGLPVTVLTQRGRDAQIADPLYVRLREGHQALAAATAGRLIYAEKSGHMIPHDQPELVATAVVSTLLSARNDRASITFPAPAAHCR